MMKALQTTRYSKKVIADLCMKEDENILDRDSTNCVWKTSRDIKLRITFYIPLLL